MYYSFTTLSTVGFGDVRPYGDLERLFTVIILVAGVSVFSVFLGDLGTLIEKYNELHADLEQGDQLDGFLHMLIHFNEETPINLEFVERIRSLFAYRWENDKNLGVETDQDRSIVAQLPTEAQDRVYRDFLFKDFIYRFCIDCNYFQIPRMLVFNGESVQSKT